MPGKQQIRAACYCRISSDPNNKRNGVTRQKEDTAVLCEINGWTVIDYYTDNDKSASNGKDRPEWDRLLKDVEAGKIDAIVVWNQDRGWRKMADLESLRPVLEPRGVLLATTNIGTIDFRNADDVFRTQVSTALSEMEVAKMRVRMKRAAKQKAESGRPQWRRAFGYIDTPDGPKPDPEKAPLVEEAYRSIIAGSSLKEVAAALNDCGAFGLNGSRWSESSLALFLHNPRNAGLRYHNGERITKGTWEPLVSESLWDQAQRALESRPSGGKKQRRTMRKYLLSGLLLCGKEGCDGYLNGRLKETGRSAYICTKRRCVSVLADDAEPFIVRLIGNRLARKDAQKLLKADIDPGEAQRISDEKRRLYGVMAEIAQERADGLMNGMQMKVATDRLQTKIDALEAQEQDVEKLRVLDGIPVGTPQAIQAVEDLTPDRFRALVALICRITVMPVGKGSHKFNERRIVVTPI